MFSAEVLLWVQSLQSPLWDRLFVFITDIGSEDFYVAVLPLLFWFGGRQMGRFIGSVFLVNYWFNDALKLAFDTPRPSPDEVRVIAAHTGPGPGFPSGHAQGSLGMWGALAISLKRPFVTGLAVVMVLAIGLSRMYLGLHFLGDVLGGFFFGLLILGAAVVLWPRLADLTAGWGLGLCLAAVVVFAAVLALIHYGGIAAVVTGAFVGFWAGSLLEERYVDYRPQAPLWAQAVKLVLGLAVVLAVRVGLKAVLPETAFSDTLRYGCIGFAVTFVMPYLFTRLPWYNRTPAAGIAR